MTAFGFSWVTVFGFDGNGGWLFIDDGMAEVGTTGKE